MHPKEIVTEVETSDVYKTFHDENPDYYLAMVFSLGDTWKIAYYSPEKDRMVTFDTDPVKRGEPEEVFKEEGTVEPIHISDVKITIEKINQECDILHQLKYNLHPIQKKIIMLQHHEKLMYNVTMLTQTMSVINIRLDATNGELISDKITSAMSFKKD
jgi:hypothetical protein